MADKTNPLDFAGSRSALIKRITMITIGANLLFICLAGFSLRQSWLRYEERAGLSTQNLAHVFAAQIGDAVDKIDLTVLTVADEVEKQLAGGGIDANSLNAFIARCQARLPMLDGLRVVNAQGENAYGTDVTPGVRVSVADRAYYLRLRNDPNAGLVISEPVVGRVSKKWSIIFARRVNKPDSSFAGVVYGAVTLKQFTKTFSTVNVGKHGALTLRNEDLALIVRYPEPANIDNEIGKKNASPEYQNAIREQKDEGNYRTNQAFDKIQRTYSFRKVPDHPFYISAGLAPDEFFATWWSEAIWISSLAMFFIFGTFFSAWLAYRGWLSNANAVQSLAREKEALRKSETLLTEAQRIARMGNWELDLQTNKLAWSDEVFQIFEIDKAKFGASWEAFLVAIHPEDRDVVNAAFKQSLETRTPCKINHRLLMPDGRIKHVQEQCETFYTPEGKPFRSVGIAQDISDRKQAEEEKGKLEDQLRQAQKIESVGRLAGGVAHDFNNMLGVILGHVELAMAKANPMDSIYANLREIRTAAKHSADLTRQLLAFARKQTVAPRVINLNETVEGSLRMLHRVIGENIQLAWRPTKELWPVKIDPSQVGQILTNLCINARHAITDVGKITIETGNIVLDDAYCAVHPGLIPGQYVQLAVSDTGCGMDKETLTHIFEPFFTTRGVGKGTGLGLATVYGAVRQNNGFINSYSEPGHGTTFKIFLPRHAGEVTSIRADDEQAPPLRGQETILLVEDEPALLEMATTMLQGQGYTVLAAASPSKAIRLAKENANKIHLLMTDVIMPEMNGQDLAQALLLQYPHLKRLFMSGYTADAIANHGVLDEGMHFIQKPFSIHELTVKVREALDQQQEEVL